jgi:hypothetical protein
MSCACPTTVLGWVEVLVDELEVVRRDADRVPAALRRAVVRVLGAADLVELAALRAVVLAVVAAASAVVAAASAVLAVVPPGLVVSAMGISTLSSYLDDSCSIEHTFVNRTGRSVTFPRGS